jgi:extracellular factor (EF) 3-hydroxypalmitic acid methyl ester biosynthesis protein
MKNTQPYELNKNNEPAAVIAEQREQYADRLNSAVDEFNATLQYLDENSDDPKARQDELLLVTTKAIVKMADACENFERACEFDKTLIKEAQRSFREKTSKWISKSYFMNRARTWPRGYAGDFETIEGVYRNIPLSEGVGYYLDRYFLATELPSAVRHRKDFLRSLLDREMRGRQAAKFLDIACGSCRELVELAPEIKASGAQVTCVDFDADALDFAANRLVSAGVPQEQTTFRRYNALKMIKRDRNLKEFGMQDVIYSVGFFDYLQNEALVPLLSSLYALLNPGGVLIMSFKDSRRYRVQEYHWFVDWDGFLLRTGEDSREVLARAGIPLDHVTTAPEKSGVIFFYSAVK